LVPAGKHREFQPGVARTYNARQRADRAQRLLESLAAQPELRGATLSGAGLFSGDGFGIRVTPKATRRNRRAGACAGGRGWTGFFSTLGVRCAPAANSR